MHHEIPMIVAIVYPIQPKLFVSQIMAKLDHLLWYILGNRGTQNEEFISRPPNFIGKFVQWDNSEILVMVD